MNIEKENIFPWSEAEKFLCFLLTQKKVEAIFQEPISVHFVWYMVAPPVFPVLSLRGSLLYNHHLT